jgi:cell wall-associated NlpC family hydrolase
MDLSYLENRPYAPGRSDCFTVVRDFYREVMGLELRAYAAPEDWPLHAGFDLITQGLDYEGFQRVNAGLGQCRFGFVLAMDLYQLGNLNHLAVYVGQNRILHQSRNGISTIEDYSPAYRRMTRGMYRPPRYEQWCESRSGLLLETLPAYQQQRLLKTREELQHD